MKFYEQKYEITLPPVGSSAGELEFSEHGNIAIRMFASCDDDRDNTLKIHDVEIGLPVLVRVKPVGFFMTVLEQDRTGWFVRVGESQRRLGVTFDNTRERWVVSEYIGGKYENVRLRL